MFIEILLLILIGIFFRILFVIVGIASDKIEKFRDRATNLVFYYIIPFICFKTTYTMPFSLNNIKIAIVANLTIISCITISWLLYKNLAQLKNISSEVVGTLLMCSAFGNVLYIGLPILTKLYGQEGMSYAFSYDFLASTPLTWTLAVAICMKYGKARGIRLKDSLITIMKIPPIWGLITGLIFRELNITVPLELINGINSISNYVISFMLLIVGISFQAVTPEKFTVSLPAILVKIVISPLFALLYGNIAGLSGIPLNVCIIEASMPSMLLSMIFASVFGVDMRTAVEMIFLTTIFSMVSLIVYFWLFQF